MRWLLMAMSTLQACGQRKRKEGVLLREVLRISFFLEWMSGIARERVAKAQNEGMTNTGSTADCLFRGCFDELEENADLSVGRWCRIS